MLWGALTAAATSAVVGWTLRRRTGALSLGFLAGWLVFHGLPSFAPFGAMDAWIFVVAAAMLGFWHPRATAVVALFAPVLLFWRVIGHLPIPLAMLVGGVIAVGLLATGFALERLEGRSSAWILVLGTALDAFALGSTGSVVLAGGAVMLMAATLPLAPRGATSRLVWAWTLFHGLLLACGVLLSSLDWLVLGPALAPLLAWLPRRMKARMAWPLVLIGLAAAAAPLVLELLSSPLPI